MSNSVHTVNAEILRLAETLPKCPHGCPWPEVHGAPTFIGTDLFAEQYYQGWANRAQEEGVARLQEHLATAHPAAAADAAETSPQPKAGDRVRVTYQATVDSTSKRGILIILPGDNECAQYFTTIPANATVEVLPPPTLAERMTALANELGHPSGPGDYWAGRSEAAERIRAELAAHAAGAVTEKTGKQRPCGRSLNGPWNLDFCILPVGHEGFCTLSKQTETDQ